MDILTVGWDSPIGLGFFLVCIGLTIFLLSRASRSKDRDKDRD